MYTKHFGLEELPFSVTPDPRFSYSNSLYREAFATLRYGIETRKGFIVITGEAGTGKTTLLRRLMRTVESTVHTAFIFNTHLDFIELLRLVLADLGIAHSAQDRLTLMAQLNDYLIEQLNKNHIVSVLVDEAQNLSDEMLEELRLLSNLETDKAKLIQLVLMGQPELERKLDQAKLRQLKQRVAVRCRLVPLRSDEVAPYILSRLQTVGYKGKELFDQDSVQKIALYSKGIPRLINVICDNALLIAYATSQSKVSAQVIDEVAKDLQLLEPPSLSRLEKPKPVSRPAPDDDEFWRSDVEEFPAALEPSPLRPRRNWAGTGIALMLAVIILAGTVLYSQQSGSLAALGVNIDQLVAIPRKTLSYIQSEWEGDLLAKRLSEERVFVESHEPMPAVPVPELSGSYLHLNRVAAVTPETADGPLARPIETNDVQPENSATASSDKPQTATPIKDQARTFVSYSDAVAAERHNGAAMAAERLEFEIYKAIHNRAIRTVNVSVTDGTAYLTGQVATERQKFVALQAARSVPGVKEVRDRVIVDYPAGLLDTGG
jgi:type II secretory pathway predicted ATPase ExeA